MPFPIKLTTFLGTKKRSPWLRLKCGCCKEKVNVLQHVRDINKPAEYTDRDLVEIGGVIATRKEWSNKAYELGLCGLETMKFNHVKLGFGPTISVPTTAQKAILLAIQANHESSTRRIMDGHGPLFDIFGLNSVFFNGGRQVGHSTLIANIANESDVVICRKTACAKDMKDRGCRATILVGCNTKRSFNEPVKRVFVDDYSYSSDTPATIHRFAETVLKADINTKFIYLG
jgi:hypothetical protein